MKPVLRWILGIALVAVLAAAVVGAAWAWRTYAAQSSVPARSGPVSDQPRPPEQHHGGPMPGPGFDGAHGPAMALHGGPPMMPFGAVFFLPFGLMQLIPLALIALLLFAAYQMGKRAGAATAKPVS